MAVEILFIRGVMLERWQIKGLSLALFLLEFLRVRRPERLERLFCKRIKNFGVIGNRECLVRVRQLDIVKLNIDK